MSLRLATLVLASCMLAALTAVATPARDAHACSLVGFGYQLLPFAVESSSTISVGRLVEAKRDVITLEVEEGLKGTTAGERLTVSNATLGLGPGCEVFLRPNGTGFALPEGARVLAFLQENELGGPAELRSALYGFGVFKLDGDVIQAVPEAPSLEQVRAAARKAGFGPASPGTRPTARTPRTAAGGRDSRWLSVAIIAVTVSCAAVAGYLVRRRKHR